MGRSSIETRSADSDIESHVRITHTNYFSSVQNQSHNLAHLCLNQNWSYSFSRYKLFQTLIIKQQDFKICKQTEDACDKLVNQCL